jgi:alpha-galactosidase
MSRNIGATFFASLLLISPGAHAHPYLAIDGRNIRIEFNDSLQSRIVAKRDGRQIALGPFSTSEHIAIAGTKIGDFTLTRRRTQSIRDALGAERRLVLIGAGASLIKTVAAAVYDDCARTVFLEIRYASRGCSELQVSGGTSHDYLVSNAGGGDPPFWSYRGRRDWVQPLAVGFRQDNYLGMNASEHGGGTPVADIWRRDAGIAVGHIEGFPLSLPVSMPDAASARLAVNFKSAETLKPGARLNILDPRHGAAEGLLPDHVRPLQDHAEAANAVQVRPE